MRIFVLGFPHTQTIDPRGEDLINICPFSEQIWYFCQMMALRGNDVIHVGTWGSHVPDGVEHVSCSTKEEWEILYGWRNPCSGFVTTIDNAYGEYRKRFAARANQVFRDRGGKPYDRDACSANQSTSSGDSGSGCSTDSSVGVKDREEDCVLCL